LNRRERKLEMEKQAKIEREMKEIEECTFKPKISPRDDSAKRDFQQFIKD
jgi:hypothetical protein